MTEVHDGASDAETAADGRLTDLIALLKLGQGRKAGRALKALWKDRPGPETLDPVVEALADCSLEEREHLALGDTLRTILSASRKPAHPLTLGRVAHDRYVNVIGSSHARSFCAHSVFFPVFLGIGASTTALTEELFEITRQTYLNHLPFLDRRQDTILIPGGDARFHHIDRFATRGHEGEEVTAEDVAAMETATGRYGALLEELRPHFEGRLFFLPAIPTFDPPVNRLCEVFNARLEDVAAAHGTRVLPLWDRVFDRGTFRLRVDLSANASIGDMHLSFAATGQLLDAVADVGALPPGTDTAKRFEWTYFHSFDISPGHPTRIWAEPDAWFDNAYRSEKLAATFVSEQALNWIVPDLLRRGCPPLVLVNVKDGWLSMNLPAAASRVCVSIGDSEDQITMAHRVLRLGGRLDHRVLPPDIWTSQLPHPRQFKTVVVNLLPHTLAEDVERARGVLAQLRPDRAYFLTAEDEAGRMLAGEFDLQVHRRIVLGHHHLPEAWQSTVLLECEAAAPAEQG